MADHADIVREALERIIPPNEPDCDCGPCTDARAGLAALDALVARLVTQTRAAYRMTEKRDEQMERAEAAEAERDEAKRILAETITEVARLREALGRIAGFARNPVDIANRALAAEETTTHTEREFFLPDGRIIPCCAEALPNNALLATSHIDWCIGFVEAEAESTHGDLLRKLREARAALAGKETT